MAGIYESPIKKFDEGVDAVRAAAPGLGGYQMSAATRGRPQPQVANAPAASASPGPGAAGVAAGIGGLVRRDLGGLARKAVVGTGVAADVVTGPIRGAGNIVSNFARGFAGQPASPAAPAPFTARAGQLATGGGSTPRAATRPVAPVTPAAPGAGSRMGGPATRPNQRPLAAPPVATSPAPAAAAAPVGPALQPGDVNTFTGGDGVTRAVPGLLNAQPAGPVIAARPTVTAAPSTAPAASVASRTAQRDIGNNAIGAREQIGADAMNPMSASSELMRRFEISQGSFKGSPQARAMAGQAILGQRAAITGATAAGADAQNEAALQGQGDVANAEEGAAVRAQRASEVNADLANSYDARDRNTSDQREERLARRPDVTVAADGSMGVVGADGTFRPVTAADGTTVRAPQAPKQTGDLTEADRLKSYDARYAAIQGDITATPEARQTALAALDADPLYAGLRGGGGAAPPAEAIAQLRSNPAVAAQFDEVFGPGASAQYLGK